MSGPVEIDWIGWLMFFAFRRRSGHSDAAMRLAVTGGDAALLREIELFDELLST